MKNKRILTHKQIDKWITGYRNNGSGGESILNEQDRKTLEWVIKWGNGPCPHGVGDFHDKDKPVTMCCRHACDQCWQELELSL